LGRSATAPPPPKKTSVVEKLFLSPLSSRLLMKSEGSKKSEDGSIEMADELHRLQHSPASRGLMSNRLFRTGQLVQRFKRGCYNTSPDPGTGQL
jgi:hypothetical protein